MAYDEQKRALYFNAKKYLSPITPELANFEIGGYKPLEKYLKSRKGQKGQKGRPLTNTEITHFQKVANALDHTIATMRKIPPPSA